MSTGYEGLDLLLVLILAAATSWYGYTIADELIKKYKKKTFWLTRYYEDTKTSEVIGTYKERNMRNAMLNHFLSYGRDLSLLEVETETDYNNLLMAYSLNIDGTTHHFVMIMDLEDIEIEQD